jgi:UTP--glucose-1-phosphate uridylyltransferase
MHAQSDIVRRMATCFEANGASAVIAFEEVPPTEVFRYGVAKPQVPDSHLTSDFFAIEDLIEKPDVDEAPSNLAIAARYIFAPEIFDALTRIKPGKGGEIQLTDAVRLLLQEGHKVYGISLGPNEERYDIGNFESYFRAFVDFALADERYGESVRKHLEEIVGSGKL